EAESEKREEAIFLPCCGVSSVKRVCKARVLARAQSPEPEATSHRTLQWIIEMSAAAYADHLLEQLRVILLIGDEIRLRRIHDQERRRIVLVEKARIRFLKPLEIAALDLLLVTQTPPLDTLEEHIDRRLQIDHHVGHGRVDREPCIHLLVQGVLLVVEREPREQPILVDEVVRHSDRVEQVVLADVLQLPCALKQEEELRLQRGRARVLVEPLEKRVFLRLLENELAPEAAREPPRD